jgi:hypothetical protein
MRQLSQFNGGGRRQIARLVALLLPSAFVVLLIGSLGAGAAAQAVSSPSAPQQFPPRAEPHPLAVSINYSHDWVLGEYAPAHTIWVTVTNEAGTVKATAEVDHDGEMYPTGAATGFATWVGGPWQPEQPDLWRRAIGCMWPADMGPTPRCRSARSPARWMRTRTASPAR